MEWENVSNLRGKMAFEWLARRIMPRDTILHTTAQVEAEATTHRLPGYRSVVIGNAVDVAAELPAHEFRPEGTLRILFLSRLHPKKGLETLLDALVKLPQQVTLEIGGAGIGSYQAELSARVSELGLGARVKFLGHLDGHGKAQAFSRADVFVLPTQSENFGIAIAEALAAGVPVITTHAAPWAGLETHRAGLWIEEGVAPLLNALQQILALEPEKLRVMGARGYTWMCSAFSAKSVGQKMLELYQKILENEATN
jgi:glycosyltransferase involved in cell wall biosynthesis